MIRETIVLNTTSQGIPSFGNAEHRVIHLSLSESSPADRVTIEMSGDSVSLRRLGEILIGVSQTPGFHVHLDADRETSPLLVRPQSVELIIENSDEPPASNTPLTRPPDWATG